MFNLFHGNDADRLAERLAARLKKPSGADPLAPEVILVPQFGLRRWLEIRLAEINGIVANVDFYAPAEYAWRLLRAARPDLPRQSQFDHGVLRWRIFAELARLAREPRFDVPLAPDDQAARSRMADELAQVFERYLAYHSDLLIGWERGSAPADWQAELWRRLVRVDEPHRARLLAEYLLVYGGKTAPPALPKRLFAFACTNISPDLLRFYGVLAQHCELDFLMPNPCREYWGDVKNERELLRERGADAFGEADNPLLAGYGRAGRDFIAQLFSYELAQPQDEDLSQPPAPGTLLHRVQTDILDLRPPQPIAAQPDPDDASLQFHVAHSRLREVQILHDQLLDLFQRRPDLTPRDVAVMAPDISAYAPGINAVFGGIAPHDPRYLPYTLSDSAPQDAHPLIALAQQLLALPASRLTLDDVIGILAVPAVARRFDLDPAMLARIETWLREAGVRWGLDGAHHAAAGAGDFREYSWEFGLERLVLGYATGEEKALVAGIAPDAAVEGKAGDALGVVLRVVERLRTLRAQQGKSHPPSRWQEIYNGLLDDLLRIDDTDRDERRALQAVHDAFAALAQDAKSAALDEALDWRCVRDFIGERLDEPERSYRFFSGGISVCGMIPLRAVPFRVICLVGMGAELFPRRERVSGLSRAPHGRERSERDDDRYLFLQLLTAARDVFYCSWVGEEQRDGSAREPSAVVAELIDVVAQRYFDDERAARRILVTRHPMQPFSARNFDAHDARVFSYRSEWHAAAAPQRTLRALPFLDASQIEPDENAAHEIALDDLRQFFKSPARALVRERFGMTLDRRPEEKEDEDPLELAGLQQYALREFFSGRAFDQRLDADAATAARARGLLPVGAMAHPVLAAETALGTALAEAASGECIDTAAPPRFLLDLPGGARLSGRLPAHQDGRAFCWRAGSYSGKHLLGAWIDFLALAAQVDSAQMTLVGIGKKDAVEKQRLSGVDRVTALEHLSKLARLRDEGLRAPLLFFPKTSFAYAECFRKTLNSEKALAAARAVFETAFRNVGEADQEPLFGLLARDLDLFEPDSELADRFAATATAVCLPLLTALETA
ncbi:MAG TPA: exodeoxyribonuclease V subunit gamma [Rudaea sp.]